MAKTIELTYDGTEYKLEFTRNSVREMEREGFVIDDIDRKPMTLLPQLFAGAFKAHHRWVKRDKIDEIYSHMPNKESLVGSLAEMYNEPILTLIEEPDDAEKNVSWTPNW